MSQIKHLCQQVTGSYIRWYVVKGRGDVHSLRAGTPAARMTGGPSV
jgi:hypothetical protein